MEKTKKLAVGILAHVDAGKTTLAEGILYKTGQIRKVGRVDHKDAFLDTEELEKARGITIFSKQAVLKLNETEVTLLDTPGHVDFLGGDGAHFTGHGLCGSSDQRCGRRAGSCGNPVAAARTV